MDIKNDVMLWTVQDFPTWKVWLWDGVGSMWVTLPTYETTGRSEYDK